MIAKLLFGPRELLVPGRPSKDAAYVRPLVFGTHDILDAAMLMAEMLRDQYPELSDEKLEPQFTCWAPGQFHDASSESFDFEKIGMLSKEQRQTLMASASGAIIEFGEATPATNYWGDDLSKNRVDAAYELLRKRGHNRVPIGRILRLLLIVVLISATAIVTIIDFLSGFGSAGLWATAFIVVGLIAIVGAVLEFRKSPPVHMPHRLKT